MGSKNKNSLQMELLDGHTVDKYQLTFTGSAACDEVNIEDWTLDDHVCLLVIGNVEPPSFKKNNEEELIRVNKTSPIRVVELDALIAEYAIAKQKASDGTPMLPIFEDPDEDGSDD